MNIRKLKNTIRRCKYTIGLEVEKLTTNLRRGESHVAAVLNNCARLKNQTVPIRIGSNDKTARRSNNRCTHVTSIGCRTNAWRIGHKLIHTMFCIDKLRVVRDIAGT